MAKTSALNNLRDMIAIIGSFNLLKDFIKLHAPSLKINWGGVCRMKNIDRADSIVDAMEEFRDKGSAEQTEYDTLFAELRTVAIVNSDSDSIPTILSIVESNPDFWNWLKDYGPIPTESANLAVFINLAANDALRGITHDAALSAKAVWKEIIGRASNELKYIQVSPAIQFAETSVSEDERKVGLWKFEEEFRLHILSRFKVKNFFVATRPINTQDYTRYIVSTQPLPHNVIVVKKDASDTETEINDHVQTFEIIIDEVHNRAHMSKTPLIGSREAIDMFLRNVLKTKMCVRERLSYAESLQRFKMANVLDSLPLPKEAVDSGAIRWIDSIDVRLNENLLPVRFRGDEFNDVYSQIDEQIKEDRFPRDGWIIAGATIKIKLPCMNDGATPDSARHPKDKTFVFRISETSFTVSSKNKTFDRRHLMILSQLESNWGIKGLTRGQAALGKGPVKFKQDTLDV